MGSRAIDDATMRVLAARLADYLWGGRVEPGAAIQADVKRIARRHRRCFGEVWGEVHRLACDLAADR
jgi:hypothetical protein